MKLTRSNGRELTVRDVGPVLVRLVAAAAPRPIVDAVEDDAAACERLRTLIATGLYRRVEP